MVLAVSEGRLVAVHERAYSAPTSIRISDDVSKDYAAIYREQPEVRVVVDFLARNIAQLGLQTFRRESDRNRVRLGRGDHPLPALLAAPNRYTTGRRLIRDMIADRAIFDRACWVKTAVGGERQLVRLPPKMWKPISTNVLYPEGIEVQGSRETFMIGMESLVYFRGYNPEDNTDGLSPIESLRRILSESYAAGVMREQVLRNGARHSGYITRPKDAPKWQENGRERFRAGWRAQYQGATATEGGGTPILEDGMTFVPASQTAEQLEYVAARKLTREEVAAAYFIPPPMVGILEHATFSNITEQHKMLYQDTLGPWLTETQDEIGLQLVSDYGDDSIYVEFNIMEKLRGSFEEQAQQLQSSVGAPFLTRAEARGRLNLEELEGTDELVVPLNVLIGGQASPRDSGSQNEDPAPGVTAGRLADVSVKARPRATEVDKVREVVWSFFRRQRDVVLSRMGAKAPWWDAKRWDRELADVLFAVSALVSRESAERTLSAVGESPDVYDVDRTTNYLRAVATSNARSINAATRIELETALDDEDDPNGKARAVFDRAESARGAVVALTVATAAAAFGTAEAAKQSSRGRVARKTWVVTSSNPRSSHAAMNGETVGIDEVFSNGASWPGDSSALDADEIAGCECDLVIDFDGEGA